MVEQGRPTFSGVKASWSIPFLVATTIVGCAPTRSTIGDGAFQKRRLNTGWHVDIGIRQPSRPKEFVGRMEFRDPTGFDDRAVPSKDLLASSQPLYAPLPERTPDVRFVERPNEANGTILVDSRETQPEPALYAPEKGIGQWNPWGVPAFALALGTVAYAIFGTSEIIVVLAVIATIILAAVAVRKGRRNEWKGKGFAIAALMIGALAGLITLIALLAG